MSKFTITFDEESLVHIIFAAAQSSCAFDRNNLPERQMWHLHCCDYNEPIYKVLKQINLDNILDSENRAYLTEAIERGKEFYQ